nr:hypothetical protein [Methylomarinum sp. Ch1-1]MDP4519733.1 hypothetical protein [Methylomarinum sp. Ch1-1]
MPGGESTLRWASRRLRYQRRVDQAQRIHQCRAASRSKPPKPATGEKLAVVRIQADCLAANPPYDGPTDGCDTNVGWIKRSGSTNVGRLREASRQKPPPGQNWPCTRGGLFNTP